VKKNLIEKIFNRSIFKNFLVKLHFATLILILTPLFIYIATVFLYSVNIPFYDDFDVILSFLNIYKSAFGIKNHLNILFERVTDTHIIFFPRLLFLLDTFLNGKINLNHLTYIANLCLIILVVLIYRCYRCEKENKLRSFLPVPFLFFQLQYWELTTWPGAAIVFLPTFLMSFLAIYYLNNRGKIYFLAAAGMSVMAIFTAGNGILVLLVGSGLLVIQKRVKELGAWIVFCFILFLLYGFFYLFQRNDSIISLGFQWIQHPLLFISYFLAATGSAPGFGFNILSISAGFFIFLYFIFLTYKKYYEHNPVIYFFMIFLMLSAFAIATIRTSFGIDIILLTSRYRMVSVLIMVTICISMLELFYLDLSKNHQVKYILAYSIIIFILSYALYLPFINGRYNEVKSGVNGFLHNSPGRAYEVIQAASKSGIYNLPSGFLEKINPDTTRNAGTKLTNFMDRFNDINTNDSTLTMRINISKNNIFNSTFHIFLQKPGVIYLFNSGLTPTTIREILHNVNPDNYRSNICVEIEPTVYNEPQKDQRNGKK